MHFLLTTLKVVYVLTTPMLELLEDATVEVIRIRAKWKNDDYICRGHILNGMSDSLFDVYTNVESAKELWDSLESKYMAEDSSSKKFLVPPSWKDFEHTLKYGKDNLSLVKLGSHLRIEESLRAQDSDKGKGKEVGGPSVNMTEEGGHVHYKRMLQMSKDDLIPAIDENPEKCTTAIDDEIGSIMKYNTWVLSDLSLGCKWIFKRKMKVAGTVNKFKARLVIQDFRQKERIDYFETYAPVARITTIILLLALAAIHNLVIHQMDVKTTFLNGDLEEEVYIKQPKGFVMSGNEHKVCKLVKSLSGLKQAPKQWHQKFDEVVLSSGFHLNQSAKCVYRKFDDSVKDCSPVSTPMDPVEKLKLNTGKPDDQLKYSRAIGCLMYAMISTRPDIAYVIGRLSYTNASWINQVEDSYFRSGWVFLFRGGVISWASKKQTCITGSTMEFEFVAFAAGKEAEWIRNLIHEILIWSKPIAPISIRCDSAPTMAKAYSQVYNGKSRHLGVRHIIVRELIKNGVISI
nr:zinc finger, CCHC-type [Tanacetum cinerariifolium]